MSHTYADAFINKEVRKCSACENPLPNGYVKKVCSLCLEKRKARYMIQKAKKEHETESQKMIKKLMGEGLPKIYWHYSTYQEYWANLGIEKSYDGYQKEVEEWQRSHIRAKADREADAIHRQNKGKRKLLLKFLRPEDFPFTDKEKCKEFRLQKLGYSSEQEPFLTNHLEEDFCATCKEWLQRLEEAYIDEWSFSSDNGEWLAYKWLRSEVDRDELDARLIKLHDKYEEVLIFGTSDLKDGQPWKANIYCSKPKKSLYDYEPRNVDRGCNLWTSEESKPKQPFDQYQQDLNRQLEDEAFKRNG